MRGAEVRWLRQSLEHLAHVEWVTPVSDVFDAQLTGLVREFQRQHQLSVDGIAGRETQIALAGAVAGPGVPLLSAADTHGGGRKWVILDALKKSESDRQRQGGPALFEVKVARPRHALPPWAIAIALLLAANIAIVALFLVGHRPTRGRVSAPAQAKGEPARPAVVAMSAPAAASP